MFTIGYLYLEIEEPHLGKKTNKMISKPFLLAHNTTLETLYSMYDMLRLKLSLHIFII